MFLSQVFDHCAMFHVLNSLSSFDNAVLGMEFMGSHIRVGYGRYECFKCMFHSLHLCIEMHSFPGNDTELANNVTSYASVNSKHQHPPPG